MEKADWWRDDGMDADSVDDDGPGVRMDGVERDGAAVVAVVEAATGLVSFVALPLRLLARVDEVDMIV